MENYPTGLTIEEGLEKLLSVSRALDEEEISVWEACGRVCARDYTAREDIPPFSRSPYDGYALRAEDTKEASREHPAVLTVIEEVPAGYAPTKAVGPGEAVKILTGAPVPKGADAIIMFEHTQFDEKQVAVFGPCKAGSNIVPAGEDVTAGETILRKGTRLSPALVGMLAGLGYDRVTVRRKVRAAILSTGDELVEIQDELTLGKIRNSSACALYSYLKQWGADVKTLGIAKDDAAEIAGRLEEGLAWADVVFTTGGVSVGDYDKMGEALEVLGAETLFWRVKMKPGSAFLAGLYQNKLILGLSGNPSAGLTAMMMLGRPLLRYMEGEEHYELEKIQVRLSGGFKKASPMRRFIPGALTIREGEAWLVPAKKQGNGMLHPMHNCQVLGEIPSGSPALTDGTSITAWWI